MLRLSSQINLIFHNAQVAEFAEAVEALLLTDSVYVARVEKLILYNAQVAELADAHDSKSCGKPCGFESRLGHQDSRY